MYKNKKIFVAGHESFIAKSIIKELYNKGFTNILTISKKKLNLLDQKKVLYFFSKNKPKAVIICAAYTGGIKFNLKNRPEVLYKNLVIQNNIIESSRICGVKDLIFLSSSSIYPKNAKQPFEEKSILSGSLDNSHEPFAIAKIAGTKLCEYYSRFYKLNYKTLILTNIFGPEDKFFSNNSSFFPSLLRQIYFAKLNKRKKIILIGSGKEKRELLFVKDVALACIFFLFKKTDESVINIGSGYEASIKKYALFICKKINVKLKIIFLDKKHNGMKRKMLSSQIANRLGWKVNYNFNDAFEITLKNFLEKIKKIR